MINSQFKCYATQLKGQQSSCFNPSTRKLNQLESLGITSELFIYSSICLLQKKLKIISPIRLYDEGRNDEETKMNQIYKNNSKQYKLYEIFFTKILYKYDTVNDTKQYKRIGSSV